jgi:hypothetical protein
VIRPNRAKRELGGEPPPERVIYRHSDGTLRERDGQRMDMTRLRDQVRAGNRFRAYHEETGAECTYQLLVELLGGALPGLTGLASQPSRPVEPATLLHTLCGDLESMRPANGDTPRSRPSRGRR